MNDKCNQVLLIEDNPGDARLIQDMLSEDNHNIFEVIHTTQLSKVFDYLKGDGIDVILLDLGLSDHQGIDTLHTILSKNKKIPIILQTGLCDEELAIKAVKAGAQDYLIKGQFNSHLLIRSISYAIERKKAEDFLRESENKYRLIAENTADLIVVMDVNLRFTYFSPSIMRTHGYTVEEAMSMTIDQFVTPESMRFVLTVFEEETALDASGTADLNRIRIIELQEYKKDGSIIIMEVSVSPRRDKENKPIAIFTVSRDITERKKMQEKIIKNEQRYRLLSENISDFVWVLELDDMRFSYCSPSVTQLYGYTEKEYLSKSINETMTKDSYAQAMEYLEEEMELEKKISKNTSRSRVMEVEAIRKDGSTVWVEMSATFMRNVQRQAVSIIGVSRDISRRKLAEETLQKNEEQYRTFLENIEDGCYEVDLAGNFTFFNGSMARMLGYSKEELLGMNYKKYTDKENSEKIYQAYNKIFNVGNNSNKRFEWQLIGKDGNKICIEHSVSVRKDSQEKAIGFRGTVCDVTERKEAEMRLRKALGATIKAIAMTVEARDPYTAGHQRRVADLARAIATEMKCHIDIVEGVRMAAAVHDLGKISIPAEILIKPKKLTDIEFNIIKTHCQSGYNILKNLDFPWPVERIVLEHHERMNGSGYPNGLTGNDTLLESQILAVADVVESMASDRPYRSSLGIKIALKEIDQNRGILYNHIVVDSCLSLFLKKDFLFQNSIDTSHFV